MTRRLLARPYAFALVLGLALLAANVIAEPSFGRPSNWPEELAAMTPFALVALASTPAILSGGGGLDISVGPLMSLANVVLVVWLLPSRLGSAAVAVPLVLLLGAAAGALNGTLATVLRFQPVLATLCMLFVFSGLAEAIGDQPTSAPPNFTTHLAHSLGPVPGALLLLVIPAAVWLGLRRTPFVRTLYLVGGDDIAALTAGVRVHRVRIAAYALGGVFAATAGIALTALVQAASPDVGLRYTLIALAAVSLGGTPLGGGRGGLLGSFLGAASIYLLQTLLGALDVTSTWLQLIYGALLASGAILSAQVGARPRRSRA